MTDLDFDELDRAVNDLMQDVDTTKRPSGLDDPEDKIVELDTLPDTPSPSPESPEQGTQAPAPNPTTIPPAVKRRGQFMDMIHPSSDMKKVAATAVKREGITIQPSSSQSHEEVASSPAVSESDSMAEPQQHDQQSPVSEADDTPSESSESTSDEVVYPDPMEFTGKDMTAEHTTDTSGAEPESTPPSDDVDDTNDQHADMPADDEPLSSPFLPDAKVEKRPLGSLDSAVASPEPQDNTVPPVMLPAELGTDVLAIESTGGTHDEAEHEAEQETNTPAAPVEEAPVASDTAQTGSIVQQYAEKPSTSAASTGAIYDTDTYHQPLDHAPKKRSLLGIVIWVVSLVLIGAAAAAAYFYFAPR